MGGLGEVYGKSLGGSLHTSRRAFRLGASAWVARRKQAMRSRPLLLVEIDGAARLSIHAVIERAARKR